MSNISVIFFIEKLRKLFKYVYSLRFEEEPDYAYIIDELNAEIEDKVHAFDWCNRMTPK